jgi:integrase
MKLEVKHRGRKRRIDGYVEGERLRLSLGTANDATADTWKNKIERAIQGGADSVLWPELKRFLPPQTFRKLADVVGYNEKQESSKPTWADLEIAFRAEMRQRIALGKLAESTRERYEQTIRGFAAFLKEIGVSDLRAMNRGFMEKFKVWRHEKICAKRFSRGGRSLALDVAILHLIFAHAVNECEFVTTNPVRLEGRPGDASEHGAQPFKVEELRKLRDVAGADLLIFLVLRWTGFRGSDAVGLRWEEIDWESCEINRVTQKRRKRVLLPIHQELLFALDSERERRNPLPDDRVLLNPSNGKALTRPRLYERILALGRRAGVTRAHPHRFRDTFAVDMLVRGASPYDIAKLLGDTVGTIEEHYTPFVRELRERARSIMENGEGLEKNSGTFWAQSTRLKERIQ